jgi:hypothetical protein
VQWRRSQQPGSNGTAEEWRDDVGIAADDCCSERIYGGTNHNVTTDNITANDNSGNNDAAGLDINSGYGSAGNH